MAMWWRVMRNKSFLEAFRAAFLNFSSLPCQGIFLETQADPLTFILDFTATLLPETVLIKKLVHIDRADWDFKCKHIEFWSRPKQEVVDEWSKTASFYRCLLQSSV